MWYVLYMKFIEHVEKNKGSLKKITQNDLIYSMNTLDRKVPNNYMEGSANTAIHDFANTTYIQVRQPIWAVSSGSTVFVL